MFEFKMRFADRVISSRNMNAVFDKPSQAIRAVVHNACECVRHDVLVGEHGCFDIEGALNAFAKQDSVLMYRIERHAEENGWHPEYIVSYETDNGIEEKYCESMEKAMYRLCNHAKAHFEGVEFSYTADFNRIYRLRIERADRRYLYTITICTECGTIVNGAWGEYWERMEDDMYAQCLEHCIDAGARVVL